MMIKVIQQLKQNNPSVLNFALAGAISLVIAVMLMFFLWQNITTENQITELQTTGQRLAKIVASQNFAEGEATSFAEFAQLVKRFNQQWDDVKHLQNNLPLEKIKEIDAIKNELNTYAPKWLALQKDIVAQTLAKEELYSNTKKMRELNDELFNILLRANADKRQILAVQQISLNLSESEMIYKGQIEGLETMIIQTDGVWSAFTDINDLLADILQVDSSESVVVTEYLEAKKIIENEIILYKRMENFVNGFYNKSYEINEVKWSLFYRTNALSEDLLSLNKKLVNNIFVYFVSIVLFICLAFLFFTAIRRNDIGFLVAFTLILLISPTTVVLVSENLKQQDFFDKADKVKTSKSYIDNVIYRVDERNFRSAEFVKFKRVINELDKQFDVFRNIYPHNINNLIKLKSIIEVIKNNIAVISKGESIELKNKYDKVIYFILYVEEDLLPYDDNSLNKYSIEELLIMKELGQRFRNIYNYVYFAYNSNHKAILDNPIDLTLSDYISMLRNSHNMANANYAIDPEIKNKIKNLSTEIESFKKEFKSALAVKEAALTIRDKNLELNRELTRLYNQKINNGLIIITLYSWLCVLICGYGYVRAINKD